MDKLDGYKVDLNDMPDGTVSYQWLVEDDFFSALQGPEFQRGRLNVALRVKRTSGAYELTFDIEGTVKVQCDRCLEDMDQPIKATHTLRARLGEASNDDGELITVPANDGMLDVAWYIYEIAALEIPLRHVHYDGSCAYTASETLQFSTVEDETDKCEEVDPRWSALKKILETQKK